MKFNTTKSSREMIMTYTPFCSGMPTVAVKLILPFVTAVCLMTDVQAKNV